MGPRSCMVHYDKMQFPFIKNLPKRVPIFGVCLARAGLGQGIPPVPVLYFSTSRVPANTNGDSYSSATEEPLAARVNSDHHLAFMI